MVLHKEAASQWNRGGMKGRSLASHHVQCCNGFTALLVFPIRLPVVDSWHRSQCDSVNKTNYSKCCGTFPLLQNHHPQDGTQGPPESCLSALTLLPSAHLSGYFHNKALHCLRLFAPAALASRTNFLPVHRNLEMSSI